MRCAQGEGRLLDDVAACPQNETPKQVLVNNCRLQNRLVVVSIKSIADGMIVEDKQHHVSGQGSEIRHSTSTNKVVRLFVSIGMWLLLIFGCVRLMLSNMLGT